MLLLCHRKGLSGWQDGLYKPVSCHLYPIRIGDYGPYKAVNYHRWDVCKAAVLLGKKENVAVYQFLKEPLIRKFGEKYSGTGSRSEGIKGA